MPHRKRAWHTAITMAMRVASLAGATADAAATAAVFSAPAGGAERTIEVTLDLETGGSITGMVVDHNEHGIVVAAGGTPYVVAWDDVETRTAYVTRRDLLAMARGGPDELTAADHFDIGLFALSRDRSDLAATHFGRAGTLDRRYQQRARAAFQEYRERKQAEVSDRGPLDDDVAPGALGPPAARPEPGLAERIDAGLPEYDASGTATATTPEMRARAREVYRHFDGAVKDLLGEKVALIETDHFLIWTDWELRHHQRLAQWCEAMYAAVAAEFGLDPRASVFLAKCPVFCWRSKARFLRFAERFDAHDAHDATGYTRSIEKNGHVHVVLLRRGASVRDFNRFASTLVHEGTHAFLHRLYSTRLIPHWVNEGCAELIAERVLGDRCPAKENAALLAGQFAQQGWSIRGLLHSAGPIEVHEYPLAYSVVSYLHAQGSDRLGHFIRQLKAGEDLASALATSFDGLGLDELEVRWRAAVASVESSPVEAAVEE